MVIKLKDKSNLEKMLLVKGFSKRSFSKKVGISNPFFVQISNGDRNPGPKIAKKICEGLEVEFDEIFFVHQDNKSYQNKNSA